MDDVVVRLANLHDREALCSLYREFHEFHVRRLSDRLLSLGDPPDTFEGSELYRTLERIIIDDGSAVFVVEVAGQPVGFAEVYIREDEPNPLRVGRRYAYLQSLMVGEEYRRQGMGTRLVEAVQLWAKGRGATEMRVETWEFGEGPLEFYEGVGYRTLRRMLVREL
jgi:GNAT superfamily N-acetyltransferase